jgi:penicillin V acylase-like amidase (Ntn superfamily)
LSLKQLTSKLKYHLIAEIEILENQVKNQNNSYQITGKIQQNSIVIESENNRAGRFIIATNRLDNELFSSSEMLKKYKEQQNTVRPRRGAAFIFSVMRNVSVPFGVGDPEKPNIAPTI